MFEGICADYSFWNGSGLLQDVPTVSPCFEETALVWVPYGYLWVTLVPYLIYLSNREKDPPLPWSRLMITKTVLTVILFCLVLTGAILTSEAGYRCLQTGKVPQAKYIADGVQATTFALVLLLEQYMRVLGVKTSGVPFVFWLITTVTESVPLYSVCTARVWCATSTLLCIKIACMFVQLVLRCFADQYRTRGYQGLDPDPCPEENASILNKITFSWITSLVVKAYKQTLTRNDLWTQTRRLQSRRVVRHFLHNWTILKNKLNQRKQNNERTQPYSRYSIPTGTKDFLSERSPLLASGYGEEHGVNSISFGNVPVYSEISTGPSIFRALIKSFGWLWIEACGYKIIGDGVNLLQPVILRYIIDVIERHDSVDAYPIWIGYTYAVALFVTSMIKSFVWQSCLQNMICLGLTIKTALIGAVYRKALTLSNSAKKSSTVGEIVNLMSVDCQRVQDAFTFSHHLLSLPFVTIVAMAQLWTLMGVAMFGGLAVVLIAVVINGILGRLQQTLQRQILGFKSKRIKILNEVINGIKVLKMYTWEIPFENKVSAIRKQEILRLWKYAMLTAVAMLFSIHSPFMVNYALVLLYTLTQSVHYIDAQTAFVVLSLVNILRGPITLTPFIINGVIQGYVSLSRIQAFLWKEDISEDSVSKTESAEYMINMENGTFSWDRDETKSTLKGIDFKIREGQIYAVVGQVGCGKSSLIAAILGEMERLKGSVEIKGKIAYVPQEAWIQNMTVRDNIIFGSEWNLERYNKVLMGCAMIPDLEMLSGGDMTEIGEKGINISGGQKQRVSLARAVYNDADIYLLDDPLSAVDSHVGKHLFKNVIGPQGLLKRKTRILVTHGIHWLPMVDKIFVLTNGKISETGTYEELISRKGPFANLVQTYLENNDESDADDTEGKSATTNDTTRSVSATRRRKHRSSERESFGMSFTKQHASEKDIKRDDQLISRLVQEEQSQKGAVQFAVFQKYARSMGYIAFLLTMVFMLGFQSLNVFSNYWLTYWTEDTLLKNTSQGHTSEYEDRYVYYLVCYTIIGVVQGGAIFAFGALGLTRMVRASGILHDSMLQCVLRSPMSFFDTTPVGRIMNRFSSDIDVMDDRLPLNFRLWNIQIFSTVATIIVVSINTPIFLVVIVPVTIIYLMLLKFFLPTARQVKRLESVLRSPIYNHFSETISGVSVIRAYRCMDRFIKESEKRIDTNIKFFFAAASASRWIAIRLETLGNILILAAAVFALLSDGLNGAQVGLSITYALQITISLNLVIQAISEMEMNIVSAERVKEYTELQSEAPWAIQSRRPSNEWPRTGAIEFRLYRTRYRDGLELTLKGISCHIRSGEKLGIVGRTGAGKSSLALSLFRLIESAGGSIVIDGQNIADIGLHDLRNKLTILPQDPVIFSGSLRENLDPFGKYDEQSLWKSLECAHLRNAVDEMSGQLEYECGEGGSSLSVGQRQLVCLARTLLHKTKVLILDEATAAVDLETDELIQETIRTEFSDCTILTIAHRLNTILDYDRVLVLSEGTILELDPPAKLLHDPNSVFFKMAKDAGLVS